MNRWERYLKDSGLSIALLIEDAFDELTDTECPQCQRFLDAPTLEKIQEWLEEEME